MTFPRGTCPQAQLTQASGRSAAKIPLLRMLAGLGVLSLVLAACAPAVVQPPLRAVVLEVRREPFIEFGETGVNATVRLSNEGGPGLVRLLVRVEAAGEAWVKTREFRLEAREVREVPLRFEEPAFVNRLLALGTRAVGSAALTLLRGAQAVLFGNMLADQLGLAGPDALSDLLSIKATAEARVVTALSAPQAAFPGLTLELDGTNLRVIGVRGNGPAATAGLQARERNIFGTITRAGDLLERADGARLTALAQWTALIARHRAGDLLQLELKREGKPVTATVVLGAASEWTRGG